MRMPPRRHVAALAAIVLTAVLEPGAGFDHWSGYAAGAENPIHVEMASSKRILAHFKDGEPSCGVWSKTLEAAPIPARTRPYVVHDSRRHRFIIFGGDGGFDYIHDLWAYSLGSVQWTQLESSPGTLVASGSGGAAYDPIRDRLLIVVGTGGTNPAPVPVWSYSFSGTPGWALLTTVGAPEGLQLFSLAYDSHRDRVLLFGGLREEGHSNQTWTLDLSSAVPAWSVLDVPGAPSPRSEAAMIYDPTRDRLVIFGGWNSPYRGGWVSPTAIADLWTLDLSDTLRWTRVVPETSLPPKRGGAAAVYDEERDRMLIFGESGGAYGYPELEDTWAILFRAGFACVDLTPVAGTLPGSREGDLSLIFDSQYDEMLLFAGRNAQRQETNDLFRLRFGTVADVAVVGSGRVVRSPDSACLSTGATLTLTAEPAAGQEFLHWSGDVTGAQNPIQVAMGGSRSIVAHFRAPGTSILAVTTDPAEAGTVQRLPQADSYAPGTHVSLVASANDRYEFAGWSGDVTGDANPMDVVVDRDLHVVANFSISTATQASLVSSDVETGRVRLVWYAAELQQAALERRMEPEQWRTVAQLRADGTHRLAYEDRDVEPGATYHYRLMAFESGGPVPVGETSVRIPAAGRLGIAGLHWDADRRGGSVSLTVASRGDATIGLYDVLGRQRASLRLAALEIGEHVAALRTNGPIASGIYFVKLTQGRESITRRFVMFE